MEEFLTTPASPDPPSSLTRAQALKWLEAERKMHGSLRPLQKSLRGNRVALMALLKDWDENNDKSLSKREFRNGIRRLHLNAPFHEIDALFDKVGGATRFCPILPLSSFLPTPTLPALSPCSLASRAPHAALALD